MYVCMHSNVSKKLIVRISTYYCYQQALKETFLYKI